MIYDVPIQDTSTKGTISTTWFKWIRIEVVPNNSSIIFCLDVNLVDRACAGLSQEGTQVFTTVEATQIGATQPAMMQHHEVRLWQTYLHVDE